MSKAMEIRISGTALTRLGSRYRRAGDTFEVELRKSQDRVAKRAEKAYASAARSAGYSRVAKGVSSFWRGNVIVVTTQARNEKGYDYSLITRFGHKVTRIYPRSRGRASVVATGKKRGHGRGAMLRFPYMGKIMYRGSVRAWSPARDWAESATPEVEAMVHEEGRKLGAVLARRLG